MSRLNMLANLLSSRLPRLGLPLVAVAILVLQGCCCSKYGGYGNCNSCGTAYPYGAGYAPATVAPGGCPDGNCGVYPSAYNAAGVPTTAAVPTVYNTAAAPVYAPVPMTATLQPVPTF